MSFEIDIKTENLSGVRKMANSALMRAANGYFWEFRREMAHVNDEEVQTLDNRNEMDDEANPTEMETYNNVKRTSPDQWAKIYWFLDSQIRQLKGYNAMEPLAAVEFLTSTADRGLTKSERYKCETIAKALEVPLDAVIAGRREAAKREDARRAASSDVVLGKLVSWKDEGSMHELSTLSAEEQLAMAEKFYQGIAEEMERFVTKGLLFSHPDNMGRYMLLKEELKDAAKIRDLVKRSA